MSIEGRLNSIDRRLKINETAVQLVLVVLRPDRPHDEAETRRRTQEAVQEDPMKPVILVL